MTEARLSSTRASTPSLERIGAWLGFGSGLFGVGTLVALHLLPGFGGVDPVEAMLSDYARGPAGAWFRDAVLAVALASGLLGRFLARVGLLRGPLAVTAMVTWCASLLGIVLFTKDPAHVPLTAEGAAHLWVTSISCVSFPVLCLALGWRFRADRRARLLGGLALANALCMLPFVFAFFLGSGSNRFEGMGTGLLERAMITVDLLSVLVLLAWGKREAGKQ